MAPEIEAKFRVTSPEPVRRKLRSAGAACHGAVLEINRYFDWPDGQLCNGDRGLRIRQTSPIDADRPAGSPKTTVTYKGPRQPGRLKIREELEFHADDADAVAEVIAALGLVNSLTFHKRRESWRLDDCLVELDELPGLGHFVEIEGPDGGAIAGVAEKLGLHGLPMESQPYSSMICRHHGHEGRGGKPITF